MTSFLIGFMRMTCDLRGLWFVGINRSKLRRGQYGFRCHGLRRDDFFSRSFWEDI